MAPLLRVSIAYLAYFTAVGAASPYLVIYYQGLGISLAAIGALAALSAVVGLVTVPAWGALDDRFPATRLTLPLATLVAVGGATMLATAHDLTQITIGVVVLSGGLTGVSPLLDARAIATLGADRIRYGQVRAPGSIAFVVAAWAVGLLIDAQGIKALFVAFIPALLVTALLSATLVRRPTTRSLGLLRGAMALVAGRGMGLFLFGTFLVWASLVAADSFLSIRMLNVGGTAALVGLLSALGAAVEAPVMWFHPRITRRLGIRWVLVAGAALFSVRNAIVALATDPMMLLITAPMAGIALALFYVGGVNFVSDRAPAGLLSTAQGVFSAVLALATIVGSAASGVIAGTLSIPGLLAICSVVSLASAVVVAIAVDRSRPPELPSKP